jgi:hypothetical protein
VSKNVWLDPSRRVDACIESVNDDVLPSSPTVNFCLINEATQNLCIQMASWKQRTDVYLCQASGICEKSDFFYSPTTFNLQEQEFVYDTVQRFYIEDIGLSCPDENELDRVQEQQDANNCQLLKYKSKSSKKNKWEFAGSQARLGESRTDVNQESLHQCSSTTIAPVV